jgi:hypothetical protein
VASSEPLKVAACIPCHGDPALEFAQSFADLVGFTAKARPDMELRPIWKSGSSLSVVRNRLFDDALQWGANAILALDADHSFRPDALLRLMAHTLPVVGTNPARRADRTGPTAFNLKPDGSKEWVFTTKEAAEAGKVEKVDRMGLGMVLIARRALEELGEWAKGAEGRSFWPLFKEETTDDGRDTLGEDYYFFGKLAAAGVPVYVDHAVSQTVGHVHKRILYPVHALAAKAADTSST